MSGHAISVHAIIVAAGSGSRMQSEQGGTKLNKVLMQLGSEPVVVRTVKVFEECEGINTISLVCREEEVSRFKEITKHYHLSKVARVIVGGDTRQQSVTIGINSLEAKDDDLVLIHNGANPLIDQKTLIEVIAAGIKHGASVVGFAARDTIKRVSADLFVKETLPREELWQIQTPQVIRFELAKRAFTEAEKEGANATDDVSLVERLGLPVKIVECPRENIKLTLPSDLEFAEKFIGATRVGFGMDSHWFVKSGDKKLVLGGVKFEQLGFEANSDGDIILHALFNAIAQGLGEHSLGFYADKMCEEGVTDSACYLDVILEIMKKRGFKLEYIGIMLEGKTPKILPIEDKIKMRLRELCQVDIENIGITATSGEGLTEFGKGNGMQCFCVVSLERILG